jgi:hypothetical protein
VDEEHDASPGTDWNAWAMPARRTAGSSGVPSPPPPPPPPGAAGPWYYGAPPPPPQGGHYGAPPPYGAPPHPGGYAAPYGGGWGPSPRINGLAIASMVCGIVWIYWIGSILALVFGYIAKGQIDRSHGGETGRGMAIAGIVLGWVGVFFLALLVVLMVVSSATSDPSSGSY